MQTLITVEEAIQFRKSVASSVAFVPTMGALHDGHRALLSRAKDFAEHTVCSIFVNPKQFGPREDFAKYPRQLEKDLAILQEARVSAVFLPSISDIYPAHFSSKIINDRVANLFEGSSRPGHFDGVLTIVCKLFNIVKPDLALFGKKDYQQLYLIARMVEDLNMPVNIVPCETIREESGLAMSSRNAYLNPEAKLQAAHIYRSMQTVKDRFQAGERALDKLEEGFRALISQDSDFSLEYGNIVAQDSLERPAHEGQKLVLLVAVKFQGLRLIDNLEF